MSEGNLEKVLMRFRHLYCEDCGDSKAECTCEEGSKKARKQELLERAFDNSITRKLRQQQKQDTD